MVKRVWTEERVQWLKEHASMNKQEGYKAFKKAFPECTASIEGFTTKRSNIGAVPFHQNNALARPLYSEHTKKGYIWIKVAQPNVWLPKHKWVWLETHPWLWDTVDEDHDMFCFLDGNNRNFSPDNIEKVNRRIAGIMNEQKGFVKGNAELTRLNLAKCTCLLYLNDQDEKLGKLKKYGNTRVSKEYANEARKKWYEAHKEEVAAERRRKWRQYTPEQREHIRELQRKNAKLRRERAKQEKLEKNN